MFFRGGRQDSEQKQDTDGREEGVGFQIFRLHDDVCSTISGVLFLYISPWIGAPQLLTSALSQQPFVQELGSVWRLLVAVLLGNFA